MRFNLRLHGRTKSGVPCQADIAVYARSQKQLQREAMAASKNAPWHALGANGDWIPEGEHITVENIESLDKRNNRPKGK